MARVTSKDVAREAGVSQTTVSFVLNGRAEHGISEQTKQQVRDAARRLGYVPSATARSLRLGRSNVVLCLLPDLPVTEALEVFKRELGTALGEAGKLCAFVRWSGVREPLSQVLQHMNPAAVISLAALPDADLTALARQEIPVIDRVLDPAAVALQGLDQQRIGYLQVEHLAAQGHRAIGCAALDDPREGPFGEPRLAGARQACDELGLAPPVVAVMAYTIDSATAALAGWSETTAVAAFNDQLALTVLGACRTRGIDVPAELAIIGVDDLPVAAISVPALSTIAMDLSVPAHDLAARIITRIGGDPPEVDTSVDVLRVIRRATT